MMKSDKFTSSCDHKLEQIKYYLKNNSIKYSLNLSKEFNKYNNIKFLGSGVNYLVAKNLHLKCQKLQKDQ